MPKASQLLSLHITLSFISSSVVLLAFISLKCRDCQRRCRWIPPSPHSAAKLVATVYLSRYNSCEEVWCRRVVELCRHLQRLSSFPLSQIVLLGSTGGSGGGGRTISCWEQPSSCSPRHAYFIRFIREDGALVWSCCPQPLLNLPFILQLLSTGWPTWGQSVPAKLSRGSVCGAVGSCCCAATWCGPVLHGASWAEADPSCRAVWTARCCDPGSTPWGTPGTEADN